MNILALDQSTNRTGWSVFDENNKLIMSGVFATKSKSIDKRIEELTDYCLYLTERFQVEHIVLEDVQSQKNPKTFKDLSMLLGSLVKLSLDNKLTHTIVAPSTWRSFLGIKTKPREVAKLGAKNYALVRYGVECKYDDESDSICIGTWYVLNR